MPGSASSAGAAPAVLFDARTVRPGMTGVGRYAWNLLAALAALPAGQRPALRALVLPEHLELARRDPALAGVELLPAPVSHESHPRGDLWLHFGLRRLLRRGEIFHGPAFITPGGRQPFARVVTLHDLFVFEQPEYYPPRFRLWLRWAMRRSAAAAAAVIVPSRDVAERLPRWVRVDPARLHVVPEAPDASGAAWERPAAAATQNPLDAFLADPAPFVLSIGTLEPRKDPATARRALLHLRERESCRALRWLWIGGPGALPDSSPPELVARAASAGFRVAGHLAAPQVRAALERAAVFASASHAEGFGLPVVEALAAGRPLVLSDLAIHREVAGPVARYFAPGDATAMAAALEAALSPAALESSAGAGAAAARERAAGFSWERAARATLAIYRAVAGND